MAIKIIVALICAIFSAQEAAAQTVSIDRQAAMLPWVARDREQALNDKALCSGDLAAINAQLTDAQRQLAEAKAEIEKLRPKTDPAP